MKIRVLSSGLLSTIQDKGRWGFQAIGMPVAGAMDLYSLKIGNILSGNPENAAALEITFKGPTLEVIHGEGLLSCTGADLGLRINDRPCPLWRSITLTAGDQVSFSGLDGKGCRGYLCFSGGIDVPQVMNSRSTYLRGGIGGMNGRAISSGDLLETGPLPYLWKRTAGLECPHHLIPDLFNDLPFRVIPGPQEDKFTDQGKNTFYSSVYTVTDLADRMGFRLKGTPVEHISSADIISDAIPLGAVQIPGHGQPIVMMADRQTTGGYAKIGVMSSVDVYRLAQKLPGEKIRFTRITLEEALYIRSLMEQTILEMKRVRAKYRSRILPKDHFSGDLSGTFSVVLDGVVHRIDWEEKF
ncbi:MAG: biotin-dependent carboxyltransferase family protein [Synergistales bacterium]|nr:biotin-dependent carboxyltransferase family protein [Synergistales bacterium]